jgi:endonuclease/exonuclease/phosphatase (EEP) superfamily protein YafD
MPGLAVIVILAFMKLVLKIAAALLTLFAMLLIVATALSMLAPYHWVLDTVANLRVQGVLAILVLLGGAVLLRYWSLVMIAVFLLLVNLSMVNFGSLQSSHLTPPQRSLRVVTTNVLTVNSRHDAIIEELQQIDADVIVVVELSPRLALRLRDAFDQSHPYRTFAERDSDNFGIGVLSRLPIESSEYLQQPGCPLSLDVVAGGYRFVATHPYPPIGNSNFASRNNQLAMLAERVRSTAARPERTVLLGDFNLTPWNATFTDLLRRSGLRLAAPRWNWQPTWYARPGLPFGLQIDHVLISDDLVCTGHRVGEDCGSDHRSVCVDLQQRQD